MIETGSRIDTAPVLGGRQKLPSILKSAPKQRAKKPSSSISSQSSQLPPIASPPPSLSMEWQTLAKQLRSDDEGELKEALTEIQRKTATTTLETDATNTIIPLCMDLLQHHNIETRGLALNIIANQLRIKNWALERLVPDLSKKLAQPNLLDLKSGKSSKSIHKKLHKDLVYTITEIHTRHPSKLMPAFKPVVNYLIEVTGSSHQEVATLACMFWGNLKVPPVPQKRMGEWVAPLYPKLNKLILGLVKCMVYHKDYAEYMNSLTSAAGERPHTSSKDMESLSDVRNYAALGFEKLCRIFTTEVTPIFKLCIQKWLQSSDWLQQEAIVLALGAYCQAMNGPGSLKEMLPDIMAQLLEFYNSEHPMLRSITCFTMVHFMNVRIKGLKDPFGRMLRGSIALLNDENCEVQDQALRSLATLLAYGNRDLTPHTRKIVQALKKASTSIQGKSRYAYYECIGHAATRLIANLEDNDFASLASPLLDSWESLQWHQDVQGTEEEVSSLCSPLCALAVFAKGKLAKHNDVLVDRIAGFLSRCVQSKPANDPKSDLMTTHIVGYLDLVSALYEGQGSGLNDVINRNKLPTILLDLLKNLGDYREEVTQSCVALVGHICKHNYSEVTPMLEDLLDTIFVLITDKSENIKGNALWTLVQICKSCSEENEKLVTIHSELIELFMNLNAQEGVIVHAATAFLYLAKRWPKRLLKVVFKDDVFTHLCALVQTQFSQDAPKVTIFLMLCELVHGNMQKVPKDGWVHFCAAAAILDANDDSLKRSIKAILHDVRSTVGNALWNKINSMLGGNIASQMRKKYSLY